MSNADLTTSDVAQELGVTVDVVRAWIHRGELKATRRRSGRYVISTSELERLRGSVPTLRPRHRQRREQWVAAEAWSTSQPVDAMSFEQALEWVSEMVPEARSHGDLVEKSLEEKVEGYRSMRRGLAFIRPTGSAAR